MQAGWEIMTGHKTKIPGFRVSKGNKIERDPKRLDVAARQRQRPGGSKKVRVAKRGSTG